MAMLIKNRLARFQYAFTLEKTVNPLNHGKTVKNLTHLECSRFQCTFPIGFCIHWLLGSKYDGFFLYFGLFRIAHASA
jgi:hypothetical protein